MTEAADYLPNGGPIAWAVDDGYPASYYAVVDKSAMELKGRLNLAGIQAASTSCTVEESVKNLRSFIGPDKSGHRRYLVHPRCKHSRYQFATYRNGADGKPKIGDIMAMPLKIRRGRPGGCSMSEMNGSLRLGSKVLFENIPVQINLDTDNLYATSDIKGAIQVPDTAPVFAAEAHGNSIFSLVLEGQHKVSIVFKKIEPKPGSVWLHFESSGPVTRL